MSWAVRQVPVKALGWGQLSWNASRLNPWDASKLRGGGGLARGRRAEGQGERAFQREQPGGEREAALGELGFVECCWSLGRRRVGVGPGGSETVVSPGIKGNSRGRAGGSTGIGPCLPTRLWIL